MHALEKIHKYETSNFNYLCWEFCPKLGTTWSLSNNIEYFLTTMIKVKKHLSFNTTAN